MNNKNIIKKFRKEFVIDVGTKHLVVGIRPDEIEQFILKALVDQKKNLDKREIKCIKGLNEKTNALLIDAKTELLKQVDEIIENQREVSYGEGGKSVLVLVRQTIKELKKLNE